MFKYIISNPVRVSIFIFCGVVLIAIGIYFLMETIKRLQSEKFHRNNPFVSSIYSSTKVRNEQTEAVTIKRIDNKHCHGFFYSRVHGNYILPGKHMLKLAYKVYSPGNARYKTKNISDFCVSVDEGKRYMLLFETGGKMYSLIELPSAELVDERTLITYLEEKAQLNEDITAATVWNDLTGNM